VAKIKHTRTENGKISHTKIKQPSFGEKRPKLTYTKICRFTVYHLNIALFLQPIDVKERCGIIQSYRVTMQEVLPFGKIENTTTETFPPDRVSYKIQLELQKKYKIKLTQRTNVGYPIKDDSHIDVFPNEYRKYV
jgi:hypothetical protein